VAALVEASAVVLLWCRQEAKMKMPPVMRVIMAAMRRMAVDLSKDKPFFMVLSAEWGIYDWAYFRRNSFFESRYQETILSLRKQ
jgi:hypothetical protein